MHLVFLGTGGSWPSPKRNVSALAVKLNGEIVLLDCGEGTQRQFMISPLSFMRVRRILISHFHGDHFLGLPGLIQSMTMAERKEPLSVHGPRGIRDLVKALLTLGYFRPGFEVEVHEMESGGRMDCGEYSVSAVRSSHNVPGLVYALEESAKPGRFDLGKARSLGVPEGPMYRRIQRGEAVTLADGRTIHPDQILGPPRRGLRLVYTGDTLPSEEVIAFAKGCDVLVHDSTVDASIEEKGNSYGHASARQAAQVAKACGARMLFLTHISPRYEDPTVLLEDARAVFENVQVAQDFLEFSVPRPD